MKLFHFRFGSSYFNGLCFGFTVIGDDQMDKEAAVEVARAKLNEQMTGPLELPVSLTAGMVRGRLFVDTSMIEVDCIKSVESFSDTDFEAVEQRVAA